MKCPLKYRKKLLNFFPPSNRSTPIAASEILRGKAVASPICELINAKFPEHLSKLRELTITIATGDQLP
jgi:hypothetical protein